jgi:hypothetical protein
MNTSKQIVDYLVTFQCSRTVYPPQYVAFTGVNYRCKFYL